MLRRTSRNSWRCHVYPRTHPDPCTQVAGSFRTDQEERNDITQGACPTAHQPYGEPPAELSSGTLAALELLLYDMLNVPNASSKVGFHMDRYSAPSVTVRLTE